jgi:hypothetical protein
MLRYFLLSFFFSFSITSAFFFYIQMPTIHIPAFAGLHSVLNSTPDGRPERDDIIDDINGEQETLPDLTPDDATPSDSDTLISQWRTSVTGASKGVTEKTDAEYRRSDALMLT